MPATTAPVPAVANSVYLSDCTGATDRGNYLAALEMIEMQGGVFGAVAPSEALLAALKD